MSYTGKIDTPSTQDGSCLIQVKSIPLAHRWLMSYAVKIDTPSTQDGSCLIIDFTCIRHEPSCVLGVSILPV
jgi:hypothetical protein